MKELGEYLKEVRTNNGVELDEAADDLGMETSELENIEDGNIRAFKDVLSMKDMIRDYAKYLGLDPEKVIDEFNDFLFEHTSKISLKDILEAEKKPVSGEKVVQSPYTQLKIRRVNKKKAIRFVLILVSLLVIGILVFWIMKPRNPIVNTELRNVHIRSGMYELAK